MMTAPDRRITDHLRASIARVAEIRDSALADLAAMPEHKAGSDWARDRIEDARFADRWIASQAARLGIGPAELLALAGIGPRAS